MRVKVLEEVYGGTIRQEVVIMVLIMLLRLVITNVSLENAKPYISDAVWYTGAVSIEDYLYSNSYSYVYERDNKTGKTCGSSLTTCNDDVERKMT